MGAQMGKVSLKKIAWKVLPRSGLYLVEPMRLFRKLYSTLMKVNWSQTIAGIA